MQPSPPSTNDFFNFNVLPKDVSFSKNTTPHHRTGTSTSINNNNSGDASSLSRTEQP
jgi:hypothetical protein